ATEHFCEGRVSRTVAAPRFEALNLDELKFVGWGLPRRTAARFSSQKCAFSFVPRLHRNPLPHPQPATGIWHPASRTHGFGLNTPAAAFRCAKNLLALSHSTR